MKSLSSKKEEPKVCENAYEQRSVQALASRRTCQTWPYGFGFRVTKTKKGGVGGDSPSAGMDNG